MKRTDGGTLNWESVLQLYAHETIITSIRLVKVALCKEAKVHQLRSPRSVAEYVSYSLRSGDGKHQIFKVAVGKMQKRGIRI